jgi:putative endopeptidase
MHYKTIICFGLAVVGLQGCSTLDQEKTFSNIPDKFIDPANMDTTVRPGNDFFQYANGNWLKNNPIPAKETRWGSFNELREFNANAVKSILEDAQNKKNASEGSIEKRVGDFYTSAMDSTAIEAAGFQPILNDLERIDKITDLKGIVHEAAVQRTFGAGSPLFSFYVGQDRKNVEKNVPQLGQGGTTLPDRDYYLIENSRNNEIKEAYKTYVEQLFTLSGTSEEEVHQNFSTIWEIEKALATAQKSRVEMRDPLATYNKFSIEEFSSQTEPLNWEVLLPAMKLEGADTILVNNPDFFKKEAALLKSTSLDHWKVYLKWNILKNAANLLSTPFVEADFAFTEALTGQKEITPRWQRSYNLIDRSIGDLLGQLYVAKYFKPEAKERMDKLVKNLSDTFAERIESLDWMSETTKEKALEKLNAFTPKIGYTEKWKTYDGLSISPSDFYSNVINARQWAYSDMVNQFGKPVDRTRWGMTPPTVNAYYSPVNNEIAFPAGILQFPFFAFNADDAINYGGIGAVIGHEMTHGFDDSGSQYAADGNLKNWWTEEDAVKFKEKADQVVEQYNKYTVLDSIHVNGKLTLGENLADLGGLAMAYAAFKKTPDGQSTEKIDGFTPDQRFFLSWAQVWRMNVRPETAAQLILTDPHSPGDARTVGPVVNMDAWYEAFDIQPTDELYVAPENRIKVW